MVSADALKDGSAAAAGTGAAAPDAVEITPELELEQLLGGISWVPTVRTLQLKPDDEWYLIVASDGLWEFCTPADIAKACGKKLRLRGPEGAARYLVEVAQRRWEHVEPDYTDDCTVIVVQMNSPALKAGSNPVESGQGAADQAAAAEKGGKKKKKKSAVNSGADGNAGSGLRLFSIARAAED